MEQQEGKRKHATQVQVMERTTHVYNRICQGRPRHEIVLECTKLWDIGEHQVDEYIKDAKKLIYEKELGNREEMLAEAIATWHEFKMRCQNAGDRKNEAVADKQLNKLKGLEVIKIDHTTNGESINRVTFVVKNEDEAKEMNDLI